MSLVVDCSVTLAWFAPDEDYRAVETVFDQVSETGAHVPFHWRSEFANGLLMMVRRKRADADFPAQAFEKVSNLPLQLDTDSLQHVETQAMDIAMKHNLTIYDAIYLETALRKDAILATLDYRLAIAAMAMNVEVRGVNV